MRPPALANIPKQIAPALNAAKLAGVEHIVFLSILGAERNRFLPHSQIERYINQLGIKATFLRASFFMQNLNTTHTEDIKVRGELLLAAGNGQYLCQKKSMKREGGCSRVMVFQNNNSKATHSPCTTY